MIRFSALIVCAMFAGTAVDVCLYGCQASAHSQLHRSCHDDGGGAGLRAQGSAPHCSHDHSGASLEPLRFQKDSRISGHCTATLVDRLDWSTLLISAAAASHPRGVALRPAPGDELNLPLLI